MQHLKRANLQFKPQKCFLGFEEVLYLGHVITKNGIKPDPAKLEAVSKYPRPSRLSEVKSFLGFASYFRRFIPQFASRATPLTLLLRKNNPWRWTINEERAFNDIKESLLRAPILAHFNMEFPSFLHTDASGTGLGAVLLQEHPDKSQRVIAYASRRLTDASTLPFIGARMPSSHLGYSTLSALLVWSSFHSRYRQLCVTLATVETRPYPQACSLGFTTPRVSAEYLSSRWQISHGRRFFLTQSDSPS